MKSAASASLPILEDQNTTDGSKKSSMAAKARSPAAAGKTMQKPRYARYCPQNASSENRIIATTKDGPVTMKRPPVTIPMKFVLHTGCHMVHSPVETTRLA